MTITSAVRLRDNKDVILKRVRGPGALTELQALVRLARSRYVVPLLDTFASGGWRVIVLPRLQIFTATSLHAARQYFHGLLQGLADIHEAGIVHLDIKPENVLVESTPDTVRIIDFNVAMSQDPPFQDIPQERGTVGWMAPEVERGGATTENGGAPDLYSAGLVLQHLVRHSAVLDVEI